MRIKDMKGKEKKEKDRKVLRCPQCGSDNITYELGLITGYKYFCKNCQYMGPLVIEDSGGKDTCGKDACGKETGGEEKQS